MSIVSETITVLKSQSSYDHIKRFRLENGKMASLPVKLPLLFDIEEHNVSSLSDLSLLLTSLEYDPSKIIIRGELLRLHGRSHKPSSKLLVNLVNHDKISPSIAQFQTMCPPHTIAGASQRQCVHDLLRNTIDIHWPCPTL